MSWLLLFFVAVAHGQEEGNPWWLGGCRGFVPFDDTPSRHLLDSAHDTNIQTYGALAHAEDKLFPLMSMVQGSGAEVETGPFTPKKSSSKVLFWGVEANNVLRAVSVPGTASGPSCPSRFTRAPADLYSMSFSLAYSTKNVGVFYVANVTGWSLTTAPIQRIFNDVFWPYMGGYLYAFGAPFLGSQTIRANEGLVGDPSSTLLFFDYLTGVQAEVEGVSLRVGVLGSKGFYTNIDEKRTSLLLRAALQRQELPWLVSGLEEVPYPQALKKQIGRTSLLGRRVLWYAQPPPPLERGPGDPVVFAPVSTALTTGHIVQRDIQRLFDARLAWSFTPASQIHEAVVGVHSPGFHLGAPDVPTRDQGGGFRVEAGMVQLPANNVFGVRGGPKLAAAIDFRVGTLEITLRRNHADLLEVFPYAVDGTHLQVSLLGGKAFK